MVHKEQKSPKQNDGRQRGNVAALEAARKNVVRQAALAVLLIVQLVVLLFAITAAWYTNIVQTNDLVFETSEWGFEGSVQLGEEPIKAAPGDEGMIPFTAVNNSDEVTEVSVNISKKSMDLEMQQRIYFYADTSKLPSDEDMERVYLRNDEEMERVYLSDTSSYTYILPGQGSLTLTEEECNDVPLKWQWVYDLLGYYVLGVVTEEDGPFVEEYLRPIEYDYDEILTTFDEQDGTLATIDGVTSAEDFLLQVSQSDGYEGTINLDGAVGGYYPVEVDESGYGVWAYLCNYTEILQNTEYDTLLGSGEITISNFTAKATVSAQNSKVELDENGMPVDVQETIESGATEEPGATEAPGTTEEPSATEESGAADENT